MKEVITMLLNFIDNYETYPDLLTREQVAQILLCTPANISKLITHKKVGFNYFKVGGKVYVPKDSLRDYILRCFNDNSNK